MRDPTPRRSPLTDGLISRWRRSERWAGQVLVALPALVAVAFAVGRGWTPAGDQSVEALRIFEVGTRHMPLVGAYSRFGWDHPGPLLFWLCAPGYRLFGTDGVLLTVGCINALAAATAVQAARKVGGATLGWLCAAALGLLLASQGATLLLDPWNPWVLTVPVFAFFLAGWAAANGEKAYLPLAIGFGSYAVQAHLSCGPVVIVGAVGCVAWRVGARWRAGAKPMPVRWVAGSLVLALGLWSGPLWQQLTSSPGNVTELLKFFTSDHPTVGWTAASHVAGRQFGLLPPWLGAPELNPYGSVGLASPLYAWAVLGVVVIVAAVAWRRSQRRAAGLAVLAVILALTSTVAMSRSVDALFYYFLRWLWPVGALLWVAGAWAIVTSVPRVKARRVLIPGLVVVSVAASGWATTDSWSVDLPTAVDSRAVASLTRQLEATLPSTPKIQMRWDDLRGFGTVSVGVATQLMRDGWPVRLTAFEPHVVKPWWTARPDPRLPTVYLISHFSMRGWSPPPRSRRLAIYDALSRPERVEADRLEDRIRVELKAKDAEVIDVQGAFQAEFAHALGANKAVITRLSHLQSRGDHYEVWLLPPGA